MKTIAIANQKGGTGKTTTTYNLGIALTQQGYRVLMVDFDPQGNLSCYCGIPPEKDLDQTITELLMKTSCEKPIGNRECVYQTGRKEAAARVDFIPSNLRLAGFELAMGTMMCREVLLKSCLEQYNNQYDYSSVFLARASSQLWFCDLFQLLQAFHRFLLMPYHLLQDTASKERKPFPFLSYTPKSALLVFHRSFQIWNPAIGTRNPLLSRN